MWEISYGLKPLLDFLKSFLSFRKCYINDLFPDLKGEDNEGKSG